MGTEGWNICSECGNRVYQNPKTGQDHPWMKLIEVFTKGKDEVSVYEIFAYLGQPIESWSKDFVSYIMQQRLGWGYRRRRRKGKTVQLYIRPLCTKGGVVIY